MSKHKADIDFNRERLEYRKGVQAFILNGGKLLITQEVQWNDNEWGFPGGKAEGNETSEHTLLRELREEFPNNTFEIIKQSIIPIKYEWPDEMIVKDIQTKGWSYRGQLKIQFLVKINEQDIENVKQDEIKNYKWVNISDLNLYLIFPKQLDSTLEVLREFNLI